MHDLVVRGGTVIDGTGGPARTADVAISGGTIIAIGKDLGAAARTIDADGALVTPGFVDIHAHYDGQASWDLISRNGQDVASGVYLYTVDSDLGHTVGRFVVIR